MPFLEVGALPLPAFLYYFYVVVRGGFIEPLVKHSSLLRRQCEQEAGSKSAPWRVLLKPFVGIEGVIQNVLENGGYEVKQVWFLLPLDLGGLQRFFIFKLHVEEGGNNIWLTPPVPVPSNRSLAER